MTHIKRLTAGVLELTKLSKVLAAFTKRGSDEVKTLVKSITEGGADHSTRTGGEAARGSIGDPKQIKAIAGLKNHEAKAKVNDESKPTSNNKSVVDLKTTASTKLVPKPELGTTDTSTGIKRARPGTEILPAVAIKRQATVASAPTSKVTASASSATSKRPLSTVGSKSSATANASTVNSKTKASSTVASKPSNFFSSYQSTAKKPQTSGAESVPSTSTSTSTSTGATSSVTSKPDFSFGGIVDGLLNPKAIELKAKSDEQKPTETDEVKAKRLRKEARRKLRVSWKADHELVSIREFTHDPEEDTGHDASSVRDAGDIMNEGKAFKEGLKHQNPFLEDGADEEEPGEEIIEESFGDGSRFSFSEIDSSEIEEDDREKNYIRFLGVKAPVSPEKDKQQAREMGSLMALYPKRSDIPPRPRSPIEEYTAEPVKAVEFGQPLERTQERIAELFPSSTAPQSQGSAPDLAAILSTFATPTVSQPQSAVQALAPQANQGIAWLEQIFAQHANAQPAQAAQPSAPAYEYTPQPTTVPNPLLASLQGLHSTQAATYTPPPAQAAAPQPQIDANSILAALMAHNQPVASQPQQYQPPATAVAPQDTTSILAQLSFGQPNYANYGVPQTQQQSQPALPAVPSETYYPSPYEHPDRKRVREEGDDDGRDEFKRANTSGASNTSFNKQWDRKPKWQKDDTNKSKAFTLPCRFWPEGKCRKGADCTYRHDPLT
jgi:hypothetical protein